MSVLRVRPTRSSDGSWAAWVSLSPRQTVSVCIYYQVQGDTIYFLGLVHERRHPDFLKELMAAKGRSERRD